MIGTKDLSAAVHDELFENVAMFMLTFTVVFPTLWRAVTALALQAFPFLPHLLFNGGGVCLLFFMARHPVPLHLTSTGDSSLVCNSGPSQHDVSPSRRPLVSCQQPTTSSTDTISHIESSRWSCQCLSVSNCYSLKIHFNLYETLLYCDVGNLVSLF